MSTPKYKALKVDLSRILPFKEPFLLIDELLVYEPGKRIVARKYLTGRESFLRGHFPGNPIMPGHLIAEAMAQTSGLFFEKIARETNNTDFYLTSTKVRFFKNVKPKSELIITACPVRMFSNAGIFKAAAHVNNKLVARGELSIAGKRP